jgi:hypothetical protein
VMSLVHEGSQNLLKECPRTASETQRTPPSTTSHRGQHSATTAEVLSHASNSERSLLGHSLDRWSNRQCSFSSATIPFSR